MTSPHSSRGFAAVISHRRTETAVVDKPPETGPRAWIGRSDVHEDVITAVPAAALAATLDRCDPFPQAGDALRPLRHWLYFLPLHRRSELGPDGHPQRGGVLPPIALPHRMWAGGRFRFLEPLRIGAAVRRVSTITDVVEKTGRSGQLAFVVVHHAIYAGDVLLLDEEHDIVYRERSSVSSERPIEKPAGAEHRQAAISRWFVADDVLLFRYSALTFNSHRIHYDRRYVTEHEGYPGLIVHGPLLATLLADVAGDAKPDLTLATFTFRARTPVFDGMPFRACAQDAADGSTALWIATNDGAVAMEGRATFKPRNDESTGVPARRTS